MAREISWILKQKGLGDEDEFGWLVVGWNVVGSSTDTQDTSDLF